MLVSDVITQVELMAQEDYTDTEWIKYINAALDDLTPVAKVLESFTVPNLTIDSNGDLTVSLTDTTRYPELATAHEILSVFQTLSGGSLEQLRPIKLSDNYSKGWKLYANQVIIQQAGTADTKAKVRFDFYKKLQNVTLAADDLAETTTALAAPADRLAVAPTGGSATTWGYKVSSFDANGNESAVSAEATTAVGAATLSGSAYNTLTWSAVASAAGYRVYRTTVGTSPTTTGLIACIPAGTLTYVDTGDYANGISGLSAAESCVRLPSQYHQLVVLYCLAKSQQREEELNDKNDSFAEYLSGKSQMAIDRIWATEPHNRKFIRKARIASLIGTK